MPLNVPAGMTPMVVQDPSNLDEWSADRAFMQQTPEQQYHAIWAAYEAELSQLGGEGRCPQGRTLLGRGVAQMSQKQIAKVAPPARSRHGESEPRYFGPSIAYARLSEIPCSPPSSREENNFRGPHRGTFAGLFSKHSSQK